MELINSKKIPLPLLLMALVYTGFAQSEAIKEKAEKKIAPKAESEGVKLKWNTRQEDIIKKNHTEL